MIIVFGSINVDIPLSVNSFPENSIPVHAECRTISTGGKGACQAIAAVRSGSKVSLIGKVGDDEFATTILNQLRREGVTTSGVDKSNLPTGFTLYIEDAEQQKRVLCASAANFEATADQIPEDVITDQSFVLLQTEIKPEENAGILERAKKHGATTVMNLAPSIDMSQKALNNLDYLIVNYDEAVQLAEKIGITVDDDALKLAEGLSKQGSLTCIVTIGAQGAVAFTEAGKGWRVGALTLEEVLDKTGAEDAYCGTLAACLQSGMSLPRALKRASIAGSLTCMKIGGVESFPSIEDIDERINDLDDPVQADEGSAESSPQS